MPLPPKLKKGQSSHTLQARVPRYLWHEFLEACRAQGYRSASEALREAMRMFIRASNMQQKKRLILGGPRPKGKR